MSTDAMRNSTRLMNEECGPFSTLRSISMPGGAAVVNRYQILQQLARAVRVFSAHPELGRTDQVVEGRQTAESEEILEPVAAQQVLDAFGVEERAGHGDQPRVSGDERLHQLG